MKKNLLWLTALATTTIIFGTIYTALQQSLRLSANDPQVQIAETVARQLDKGVRPKSLFAASTEISNNPNPFTIIYDKQGKVVVGSGTLGGKVPTVPFDVLKNSNGKPYNFVTWQPQNGVRLASVEVSAKNYYVLSARSLYETEKRVDTVGKVVVAGWLLSMVVLAGAYWLLANRK